MTGSTLTLVASVVAVLFAFICVLWVFYDSSRRGLAATTYKTIATVVMVLALPGLVLALSPDLAAVDENVTATMTILGIVAGIVAIGVLLAYMGGIGLGSYSSAGSSLAGADTIVSQEIGFSVEATPQSASPQVALPSIPAAMGLAEMERTRVMRRKDGPFAWLMVTGGPQKGREIELSDGVLIGRDGNRCQIVIEDDAVSELHARLRFVDGQFQLHDLGTTNGTFVNGEQIFKQALDDHDKVKLGGTEFVYLIVQP